MAICMCGEAIAADFDRGTTPAIESGCLRCGRTKNGPVERTDVLASRRGPHHSGLHDRPVGREPSILHRASSPRGMARDWREEENSLGDRQVEQDRAMATQLRRNSDCSEAEWTARQELAACYRIFDMLGWSESIYNHITVRVPGEEAFLINPYGLLWSEVTASNLIKIDSDGNKLCASPYPVNKAGFTQHACFHKHIEWAHAIVHTHTTRWCVSKREPDAANFYAYFFEGDRLSTEKHLCAPKASGWSVLSNNHVLMLRFPARGDGQTFAGMFLNYYAAAACEIQSRPRARQADHVPAEVVEVHQRDRDKVLTGFRQADFEACGKLDSRPGWRECQVASNAAGGWSGFLLEQHGARERHRVERRTEKGWGTVRIRRKRLETDPAVAPLFKLPTKKLRPRMTDLIKAPGSLRRRPAGPRCCSRCATRQPSTA